MNALEKDVREQILMNRLFFLLINFHDKHPNRLHSLLKSNLKNLEEGPKERPMTQYKFFYKDS